MCLCPVSVVVQDFFGNRRSIAAPCGKCLECVVKYQNMWKCRLIEEDRKWSHCYFFTLTYSDDHLPYTVDYDTGEVFSSARKADVQSWLKRFRQAVTRKRAKARGLLAKDIDRGAYKYLKPKFSYFICAEYGPNGTHRPHYHGLLFTDMPYAEVSLLICDWRKRFGFVNLKRVKQKANSANKASAPGNYCAKYCCKGEFSSRVDDIDKGLVEPAWKIMSKGIGDNYLERCGSYHLPKRRFYESSEDYIDTLVDRCFYFDGEYKYPLPRYYRERLFQTKVRYPVIYYDKRTKKANIRFGQRYAAITGISIKMSANVRDRIDKDYQERFERIKSSYKVDDSTASHILYDLEEADRSNREKRLRSKLNKFYTENKLKYKKL